ncbi:cation channel family protein (macronuclear) [Tetrahymena thermophila SB210]|uniref:Cation channel family protein n=1 Tax=Tetrahymena thermophila (strain SB210) TaxID=312017 RepID=I7M1M6_TETTS|nr:cation channel family protein [Tetrahymena thermophila SB210]EAR97190.2 cation channel family protein [Tetrahymena thermophila SB210]|eukprot:XP_001017435.2 cation channel family protein [Tetrahymena thermophila SB210]
MRDSQSLKSQYQFDNFLSVQTENQDSENMKELDGKEKNDFNNINEINAFSPLFQQCFDEDLNMKDLIPKIDLNKDGREVRQLETLFTQEDEQMLEKNILRQDQSNKIRAHNILTQKSSDQNSICLSQQNQLFDLELKNTQDSKIVDANSNNIRNSYASYNLSQLTEKIRNSIIKNRKIQQISPNFQPENKSKKNSLINFTGLDLNQKKSNQSNRKWNVAVNLSTALRVKQKLKSFLPQKFSKVSQYELTLIGDASYMNEKNNLIEINHKYKLLSDLISHKFHPESMFVIIFKLITLIITTLNIIIIPMIITFNFQSNQIFSTFYTLSLIVFFIRMIIKFKTAIYDKGEIIYSSSLIIKNYVKDGFILDVISLIGYVLGIYSSYFFLFTFLRVNNIMKLMDDINNRFYLTEKYQKFWVLTKLFAMIILMNHFFACFFHYIGNYFQNDPSDTWIKTQGLDSCDWIQRYTEALYFSFITCITIGYGDITPKNDYERLTVIIFSCLSTVCFSYSVNTIGSILQDYQNKYQKYIQMRYNAIKFMGNRKINKELQMRALKYIEYIQTIEEDSPENGLSVVNQMSSQLKFQIFSDFYGKILSQHKYFALNYSKQTINKLSSRVQEKLFVPGEVIFEQGEQDMRLFYLIKGECEYYLQNKGGNKHSQIQSIAFTNEQNFFGYKGFISGIPREMSCRSTNITHVFYISRDDLISVLKEDPLDYEQFCKVRDQYQLYTSSLGEQCFTCKSYKHTMIQCPKIHFSKNRQLLMYKYNYSADQIRQYKKRKCLKYATILNMDLISFCAKKYRKNITTSLNRQRNDAPNNKFNENYQECLIPDKIYSLQYPYVKFQGQTFKDIKLYDNQDLDSDSFSDSDSSYSQSSLPSQQTINEDQYNEDLEENDDDQDDFNNQKQLFLQNSKKSSQDQENKQLQSNDDIDLFQENKIKRNNFMQRKLSYSPTKKKSSSPDRKKDSHQNSQQKQEEGEINMKKKLFTKQVESKNQGDIAKKINSQNKINSLEDLEKQQCNQQQNNSSNPTSFSQMCLSKKSSKQRNLNDQNKNQKQLQKHHIEFNIDNISIQNWFESKKSYKSQKSQKLFDRSDKPGSIESLQNENKLYKSMSHKMQEKCNIQKQQIRRQKAIKSMTLLLKQNSYKEQKQINNNINELHLELSKQKFNQILEKQNQFMQQIAKSIQQLQESQKNNILNLADHSASQHEQNSKDNEQMKLHRINVKNTQQIDSDLFFYEFDSVKEFKKYFPYNNASSVCQSLKPKVNQNQQINNQRYSFLSKRSIYQKKNSLLLKSKSEFYKQKQQQDKE